MGELVTFSDEVRLDQAWERYATHIAQAVDEPRLMLNRVYVEKQIDLFERFKRAYLASERG